MKRIFATIAAMTVGAAFAGSAMAQDVTVEYSAFLSKHIDRVNQVEQIKEERFRKYRVDERRPRETVFHDARWRFDDVQWTGETLIPELEDYTVSNLLKAMIKRNLDRLPEDERDPIRVMVNSIKVTNHSVAVLNGVGNYVEGTMERLADDGSVKESVSFTANLVVDFTLDQDYAGEKFAFAEIHRSSRVGPTLSYFVKEGLERLYPEHKDKITGPILVTYRDPQTRLIQ